MLLRRHRYTLAEDAFDVDLWSLRDAITLIRDTRRSGEDSGVAPGGRTFPVGRLPRTRATCGSTLIGRRCAGTIPYAAVALANELKGRPERAAKVLEAAGRHHPDDEVLTAAVANIGISV